MAQPKSGHSNLHFSGQEFQVSAVTPQLSQRSSSREGSLSSISVPAFFALVTLGSALSSFRTSNRKLAQRHRLIACNGAVLDKPDQKDKNDTEPTHLSAADAKNGHQVPSETSEAAPDSKQVVAKEKTSDDGWAMFSRFMGALWETFIDVSTSRAPGDGKKGWEYRKGIEGMSLGSLPYEMLTTSKDTDDFKSLEKEYKSGMGVPFVNLSIRNVIASTRDISRSLGIDGIWLTFVNVLQTVGLSGDLVDGIPVQNKWINIVKDNLDNFGKQDSASGQRQVTSFMKNMVMGQMERITGAPMPVFLEGYGESEGVYKIVIGPRSVVVVADPLIVKRIFTSSQENYTKGILSEVLEPIMGKGLIPADPVTWKQRRRAILPGLHKQWLQDTTALMVECGVALCKDLERSIAVTSDGVALVNMEEKFTSASLDIIGKAVFDYNFGSVERESPLIKAVYSVLREAERRAQSVIPYWNLPGASSMFRDQKSHSENLMLINAVLDELIRNAMQEPPERDSKKRLSLLHFLVLTKNEDVTTRQLRDDLMTLLIAGHETTAALLTWTLHELTKPENSKFLEEVKEEVDTVLEGREPTFEDFSQLPLLRYCLVETLRLYPAPPLLIRRCTAGDTVQVGPTCNNVKGDTITFLPGQDIFISSWSLQRSTKLWGEDANSFNPYRWKSAIPGKGLWAGYNPAKASSYPDERASDYAFLPFGAGPRKCIGDTFALLEAEACLTTLLQRFSFTAAAAKPVELTTGATIHTAGGLYMDIKLRDDARRVKLSEGEARAKMAASTPHMERKTQMSVAQRIAPEALVVPTPRELRMLFTQQKEDVRQFETPQIYDALEAAYKQCKEITREHSKTFFLGSQLLDEDEQRVVWAIYNWCRSTDELVDGPEAENTTMEDLERWEEKLNATFQLEDSLNENASWDDLALADSVRRFSLIQRPFQDMIGGMAMDLVKVRYANFQELEVYCYRVAGTVGIMTLPVLGFDSLQNFTEESQEETIAAAMALGVALQLTNILRDIGEDARRGRIYVPLEDLQHFGITEDEILQASHSKLILHEEKKWRDFMEFQMERCETFYVESQRGIVGLSEVNRLGVMAALYVYRDILKKVRENNYDNLSRRAYVPFVDKLLLMSQAWLKCRELQEVAEENIRTGKIFARNRHS